MSSTLINLVVIAIVIGTVALAIFTYITNKRRQASTQSSEKDFRDWLFAQQFAPDHFTSFSGTGVAIKHGESRIALQSRGTCMFYPLADVRDIKSVQTTTTARPLGAAPGVVEVREFTLFILELHLENVAVPIRILLQDEKEMLQWEQYLKQLINNH